MMLVSFFRALARLQLSFLLLNTIKKESLMDDEQMIICFEFTLACRCWKATSFGRGHVLKRINGVTRCVKGENIGGGVRLRTR